jgi:hypothetical protein
MNDSLRRTLLVGMAAAALGVNNTTQAASCYRCCIVDYSNCISCGCWSGNDVTSGYWGCSPGQNCGDNCELCNDGSCNGGWPGNCTISG